MFMIYGFKTPLIIHELMSQIFGLTLSIKSNNKRRQLSMVQLLANYKFCVIYNVNLCLKEENVAKLVIIL